MPKLPSVQDLGQRPVPQAVGGVVGYNPSTGADLVESQAIANFGQEVRKTTDVFQTQMNDARAKDADAAFTRSVFGHLHGSTFGQHDALDDAGHVAEIKKDQFALIAPDRYPAIDTHVLPDVLAEFSDVSSFHIKL